MAWQALVVGSTSAPLPQVAGRADVVAQTREEAALVLVAPALRAEVVAAARARWPSSWLVPLAGAGPRVDDRDVLAALAPAAQGFLLLDASGRLQGETPGVAALLDLDQPLAGLAPAAVIAPAQVEDPVPSPDLGNRLRRMGGQVPVALGAWTLGEGEATRVVVMLDEATAAVQARTALRQAEAWHRTLVDRAEDAVAVLDADGTVRFHSPGSIRALGLSPQELVGQRFLPPYAEDRARVRAAFDRVRGAPGASERVVFRVRHPDGAVRWVESLLSNRLGDPAVHGIVVNTRDVTERRELEGRLRESERLRVAELLAATVAHDLNNMISVVLLGLDQLQAQAGEPIEQLQTMRATTERAAELARRLAVFGAQRAAGLRRVELGAVVGGLVPVLRAFVRRGQELVVEVAEGAHPVRVDVSHLEQAVVNLVVNARDALVDGGRVRVAVQRRPGAPPRVALVVEDDGAGMTEEVRSRAGQPYFTTKAPGKGTGLGLVVVHELAREAEGEVVIESSPGRGTRVEVLLPIDVDASESIGPGYPGAA